MIEINDLQYQYGSKRKIFTGLNLNLTQGKIYGVIGPNGAGKSSLLKCIAGLLIPKSGTVRIGSFLAKDRLPSFLSELFFLPEEISNPNVKPAEYGKFYGVFYPRYEHLRFQSLCEEFEIPQQLKLDEMSYGQKKKTLISFGIACNTRVLLLDEPTNGLDIQGKSQFRRILAKSTTPENIILISTHQIRDIENLIDHILIINEGGILFNQSLTSISSAFYFVDSKDRNANTPRIYQEESIHGYSVIEPNPGGYESRIDLEVLYQAVMHDPRSLNQPFN